jgi:hypothetical protein
MINCGFKFNCFCSLDFNIFSKKEKTNTGGFFMDKKEQDYQEYIKNIADQLEKAKIGDYITIMQNPARMVILNFTAGIARGLGIAVGFAILGAIVIYMLQRLVLLNLPIIGGVITEIVKMVQTKAR